MNHNSQTLKKLFVSARDFDYFLHSANNFNVILEYHRCEPVYLELGQELCSGQDNNNSDDNISLLSVNFLTAEQLADYKDNNTLADS